MAHLSVDQDGFLAVSCDYEQREIVKEIGGRWDSLAKCWIVSLTISNVEYLISRFDDLTISSNLERKVAERKEREEKLMRLRGMAKADVPVRLKIAGIKGTLYNYQKLGVMFSLANGEGVLLADQMGLGKSKQAIATAMCLKEKGKLSKVLVVVPSSLKFNWPLEIEKWTDEKYVIIDGSPDERISQWLRDDVMFYIVNFELLQEDLFGGKKFKERIDETESHKNDRLRKTANAQRRARILTPIRLRKWDMIVVDEAQGLRHHSSARTRNIKGLMAHFRMALTGTPLDGRLEELHSVMEFVQPGLLESKTRFLQKHATTDFWGNVTGYKRVAEVTRKIAPFFIRRLKEDVLPDLPDKIYENRVIALSSAEMAIYKELASKGHKSTEDAEAMVCIIRCKQFCDDPRLIGESIESSKMLDLKNVLDEIIVQNGHKVLLFSQYAEMVKLLMPMLDSMGLKYFCLWGETPKRERADMQEQFNQDKSIDLMIGTEAMSLGLNLTGANYVVLYDQWWSNTIVDQAIDRAHRIGQKNTVTIISFICKDTIEERIIHVLKAKANITSELLGDDHDEMMIRKIGTKQIVALL